MSGFDEPIEKKKTPVDPEVTEFRAMPTPFPQESTSEGASEVSSTESEAAKFLMPEVVDDFDERLIPEESVESEAVQPISGGGLGEMVDDFGEASATGPEVSEPTIDNMEDLFDKDEIAQTEFEGYKKTEEDPVVQIDLEASEERQSLSKNIDWIRENIECLLIAMLMALFIRHYGFEPFQIPTGSMATTLLGKHVIVECPKCKWEYPFSASDDFLSEVKKCPFCLQPIDVKANELLRWGGEKILANKMSYRFGSRPERYDTVVFRPPDRHQNFIKRMVSAGDETIYLLHGDLFFKNASMNKKAIAPKPERIQEHIWIPVYDLQHDILATRYFKTDNDDDVTIESDWSRIESNDGRTVSYNYKKPGHLQRRHLKWDLGGDSRVINMLAYNNADNGHSNSYTKAVGDLRIAGTIEVKSTVQKNYSLFTVEMIDGSIHIILEMGSRNQLIVRSHDGRELIKDLSSKISFDIGRNVSFDLQNWDDQVKLSINGKVVVPLTPINKYRMIESVHDHEKNTFYFSANHVDLSLTHLKVWRDLYYKPSGGAGSSNSYVVPHGTFFALGDNVNNSSDSRTWKEVPFSRLQGRPWFHLIHLDLDRPFSPYKDWTFGRVH